MCPFVLTIHFLSFLCSATYTTMGCIFIQPLAGNMIMWSKVILCIILVIYSCALFDKVIIKILLHHLLLKFHYYRTPFLHVNNASLIWKAHLFTDLKEFYTSSFSCKVFATHHTFLWSINSRIEMQTQQASPFILCKILPSIFFYFAVTLFLCCHKNNRCLNIR